MAVSVEDIKAAAQRIAPHAVRTPLLRSARLDDITGARVLLKPECLQVTGAFKFRGALNRILSLPDDERERGVVAWSSGNHGLAVAEVCRILGLSATVVMPTDTPAPKIAGIEERGAVIVLVDRVQTDRAAVGMELANEHALAVVPPYDHPDTIAGQGTIGLELLDDCRSLGMELDAVVAPLSGGGLTAGLASAMVAGHRRIDVTGVEPTAYAEFAESLATKIRQRNDPGASSICDALQAISPGEITFEIFQDLGVGAVAVDDDAVRDAMRFAFAELKLVLEPSGAVALAAVLSSAIDLRDRTVAIVLSGGNAEPGLFANTIADLAN